MTAGQARARAAASAIFAPDLLAGRSALVTGGGSGIGFGIADCLAGCGASVALFSRSEERLREAAGRLRERHGREALVVAGDVREPDALRRAVDRVVDAHGALDILVNNAAGNFYAPSAELSPNGWRAVIEIDLFGTFHGCQAAFPVMRERGFGRIISTSMTLHYRGWPMMAHATAAKAGVDALTRTLALEWGAYGINVNAVAPGPVPTEGVKKAFAALGGGSGAGGSSSGGSADGGSADAGSRGGGLAGGGSAGPFGERSGEEFARRFIPAGRLGRPEDIGRTVAFLASPAGDWITGAILVVDGGESLASPRILPRRGGSAAGSGGSAAGSGESAAGSGGSGGGSATGSAGGAGSAPRRGEAER